MNRTKREKFISDLIGNDQVGHGKLNIKTRDTGDWGATGLTEDSREVHQTVPWVEVKVEPVRLRTPKFLE